MQMIPHWGCDVYGNLGAESYSWLYWALGCLRRFHYLVLVTYLERQDYKGGLFRVGAMNTVFLPHWARDVH